MMQSSLRALIELASQGDSRAESQLAEYFYPQALWLARRHMDAMPKTMSDEDDLANSAIKSICLGVREGRIQFVGDDSIHALLKQVVLRKIQRLWRYHAAAKRGIGRVESSNTVDPSTGDGGTLLSESTIEFGLADQVAVNRILESLQTDLHGLFRTLFASLDPNCRQILLWLLDEDLTRAELSARLDRSLASVDRYLETIRRKLHDATADG